VKGTADGEDGDDEGGPEGSEDKDEKSGEAAAVVEEGAVLHQDSGGDTQLAGQAGQQAHLTHAAHISMDFLFTEMQKEMVKGSVCI